MSEQSEKIAPQKTKASATDKAPDRTPDTMFLLEEIYPDTSMLFSATSVPYGQEANSLVAFDTNALLLPYNIGSDNLNALGEVFEALAKVDRLFVPARVVREFIKNRDGKLSDMLKALNDKKSKVSLPEKKIASLLDGVEGYDVLLKAVEEMKAASKRYEEAHSGIVATIKSWRGDDPVSVVYDKVFKGRIAELIEEQDDLSAEWERRRLLKIPPGYKDANKDDTGIGDFLIWKTLLQLGKQHKKDLIFITGEEKADWFVRSDKERIYPRPELIDEYRRVTGGKNIRLSTLYDLLEEMNVPEKVVDEVRTVEQQANNAIASASVQFPIFSAATRHRSISSIEEVFDYSTHDGRLTVRLNDLAVPIKFSKASDRSIHLYRDLTTVRIARVKDVEPGTPLNIDDFDTTSRAYKINVGDVFMAETDSGNTLVGRIASIKDDSRNADHDEVVFHYYIFGANETAVAP